MINTELFKIYSYEEFNKKFFKNFVYFRLRKGEKLISLEEKISNLFFIKEGTVLITITLTIENAVQLYNQLSAKFDQSKEFKLEEELIDMTCKEAVKFVKKKYTFKLVVLCKNEIIGFDDVVDENQKSMINIECSSESAVIYKIEKIVSLFT